MHRREAWLWQTTPDSTGLRKDLARCLSEMDIALCAGPGDSHAPGVVVFDEVADSLCTQVEEWARDGHARLLLLARRGRSLSSDGVWRLLRAGATDLLALDGPEHPLRVVAHRLQRWIEIEEVIESPAVRDRLIGRSRAWRDTLRQVVELALHTRNPILITGESGTGKELVAQLIHDLSTRGDAGELVLVDCTTIVTDLSGSEFFGHERGAFTGAHVARDGLFARADGGTLFLDEVGELPLRLQAELLRVVQEGMYRRVGSDDWRKIRFRLICATNRNLDEGRSRGEFRDDFYHRLAGGMCTLPPLSTRREDIPILVEAFLRQSLGHDAPVLDPGVRDFLLCRDYPGNVRELRQVVARIASRYVPPGPISVGAIPECERQGPLFAESQDRQLELAVRVALARGLGVEEIRQSVGDTAYRIVLTQENGNTSESSKRLKVSPRAVQMYVKARVSDADAVMPAASAD